MRTPRQEELGKRLVAMVRSGEERREELNTWELANINCKVKDIIEDVKKEGSGSIDNQGTDLIKDVKEDGTVAEQQRMKNMEAGKLGRNEVDEVDEVDEVENEVDKEVEMETEVDNNKMEVEMEVDNNKMDSMEESSSAGKVAEGEELETGVSLRVAADAGTAGSLIISFIAFN